MGDKRRHKRIDRLLKQDCKQLEDACKKASATAYYCHEDAQAVGEKLIRNSGCRFKVLGVTADAFISP